MRRNLVRIINGRIAELNTESPECSVPLPDALLGTHLDSWLYVDGEFVPDPGWQEPAGSPHSP